MSSSIGIERVCVRAFSNHSSSIRNTRSGDMKTFVEGTNLKFTMIISEPSATCTITIEDPNKNIIVDTAAMTKDANYVYFYEYQTQVSHFGKGDWRVTYRATLLEKTALTQDVFSLLDNRRIGYT